MSWTAPRTWVAGETVTASLINTHLRDNLLALFTPSSGWPANPIVKAGVISATTDGGGHLAITFPTAFPNSVFIVLATGFDANSLNVSVTTFTTTTLQLFFNVAAVVRSAQWLVVGN